MPRNGSGVYSLPGGSTVTNGDTSDATDLNTPLSDIVDDLNAARPVVAGGTGATTASGARTNLSAQEQGDVLDDLNTLGAVGADGEILVGTGAGAFAWESGATARTSLGLGDAATKGATGSDSNAVTGTAGTDGNLSQWNADGDLVDGPDVLDEDDMSSDSDTAVPTQQSVKAYVDALPFSEEFESSALSITSGGSHTVAHGLSARPRLILGELVCTSATGGYSVGDVVPVPPHSQASGSGDYGYSVVPDATNLNIRFSSNTPEQFYIIRQDTGAAIKVSGSNFDFRIRAWV